MVTPILTRSIIILVLFVLASCNIVAYAFATSASFAIYRNRHHSQIIISPLLTTMPTIFFGYDGGIRNTDASFRLFSSSTTAAANEEDINAYTNNNYDKGPWWTRIRIGDGGNHRRGGKRGVKAVHSFRIQVVDSSSAVTAVFMTPTPRWRLPNPLKQLPRLFASFLTKEKQHADRLLTSSSRLVRHDNDISNEGRRKLFPFMLLPVIGLRSKDEETNHRSSAVDNIITPLLSTGIAKCGYSTAAELQSKLAIGMALSSVPTAMGRLWFHRRNINNDSHNQHHRSQAMLCHTDRDDSSFTTTAKFAGSKALSSRGGGSTTTKFRDTAMSYHVVDTPLFPIYVPEETSTKTTLSSSKSSSTLDINVAATPTDIIPSDDATATTTSLTQAMTRPLLTKELLISPQLTGRELYHPTSMESLAQTGLEICSWDNRYIQWTGERKADKFIEDHHPTNSQQGDSSMVDWYDALDSSQEVLTWVGKFIPSKLQYTPLSSSSIENNVVNYYGAELPVIKTISIIHHSPAYLANLLMDSTKVKAYNKMSIGRSDVHVFQKGIDTINGPFGDGESKVVRNLTKPPIVSGIVEFVTCMHARKLRVEDVKVLSPSSRKSNLEEDVDGYIVVSRAIVGGSSQLFDNTDIVGNSEKLVRNEILLGVNVLRAIPGQPNKTELTSVTHVYSPMIPLMLAKSAGVKGATDFVRDIRALQP